MNAVKTACVGKTYDQFPPGFRTFITHQYNSVDVDGNLWKKASKNL